MTFALPGGLLEWMSKDQEEIGQAVALVALAGRFSGANPLDEFWRSVVDGERIPHSVPARQEQDAEIGQFDAALFGVSPEDATQLDPRQCTWMEHAWEALEAAGYAHERHTQVVGAFTGGAPPACLDKNPSPTARLPLWLKVFPELRVLIALRDPRDVVLSCYFQNIPLNAANVNFLSFERLARHYADLMDIWLAVREWEGFAWLEVRYEDTVADLEKEGRRVTEFLGLTWHEDQGRFYEKSRTKQLYSPTYQDVTRPVYSRSVARWRAYEKHLAPVLPALEPYCRKFGYE